MTKYRMTTEETIQINLIKDRILELITYTTLPTQYDRSWYLADLMHDLTVWIIGQKTENLTLKRQVKRLQKDTEGLRDMEFRYEPL